jgi:hypothetical protein
MSKLIRRKQIELTLKNVADGTFGNGNIAGVSAGDEMETAFDKIIKILDKMSPAMPPELQNLQLARSISSTNGKQLNGTDALNVFKYISNGQIMWTTTGGEQFALNRSGHFRYGDSSTAKLRVTHSIGNQISKSVTLSNIDTIPVGTESNLCDDDNLPTFFKVTLVDRQDYYSDDVASATKSDFYTSLKAAMSATMSIVNAASEAERIIRLEYSEDDFVTVSSLEAKYRIESNNEPMASASLSAPDMAKRVSGVPTLDVNQIVDITGNITNGIKFYYPSTIGESTVTGTNAQVNNISGTYTANATYSYSASHVVRATQYSETISGTIKPYDIFGAGVVANAVVLTNKRVDTISLAKIATDTSKRKVSPITNNPFESVSAIQYGISEHINSLATGDYLYQLQLLNGNYIYPKNNYTAYQPGLNYSNLHTDFRYVDFEVGSISDKTNLTLTITGDTFTEKYATSNFRLYVKVDGATGWLNANEPAATGIPINDNDGCINIGDTTNGNQRRITFGTTISGVVYVRLGINSLSSFKFQNISIS